MSTNSIALYWKDLVRSEERAVLFWSFTFFFCLLCGYFVLRPIREQMGVAAGVENYQWLFSLTLVTMILIQPLYGKIVSKFPRKTFMPYLFGFFTFFILLLWLLLKAFGQTVFLARLFFVFVSVYNVFTVSLFWSFMADIIGEEQGKRLFGLIAAGGSIGGIVGTQIPIFLVEQMGSVNLILVSFALMMLVLLALMNLRQFAVANDPDMEKSVGGGAIEGIRMIGRSKLLMQMTSLIVIATFLGTVLYYLQGYFVREQLSDPDQQTKIFSQINFYTNVLTLFFQFVLTPYLLQRVKIHKILAIMPTMLVLVFALVGLVPMIYVALGGIMIQRSMAYGIMKPPTDWLFTGLDGETKYKFKNFLDTVVYRTGDTAAQWLIKGFTTFISKNIQLLALLAVIVAIYWVKNAITVGRLVLAQQAEQKKQQKT